MRARFIFDRATRWIFVSAALVALLAGCVDRRTPEDPQISGHPAEFNEETSADFHGDRVFERGPDACKTCHGSDLHGTADTPSCYDCHDGAGGHPYGYAVADNGDSFHGRDIDLTGTKRCKTCHGADLEGGWARVSCWDCHNGPSGHPDVWLDPASSQFHGRIVVVYGQDDCARCHGYPPSSGTAGVSCADCHN